MAETRQRRTVLYTGTVQGVGFRFTTVRVLADVAVSGYVRNLIDGRVELVIEGEPSQTEQAVARVRRALGSYVRNEAEDVGAATGEFTGFEIRR
ncbi:MAG: acylphosphatase [Planctomycetota bacterium]|jgi:acylphosphatase